MICESCGHPDAIMEYAEFPNPETGCADSRTLCRRCAVNAVGRPGERSGPRIGGVRVRRFATSRIGWRKNHGGGA